MIVVLTGFTAAGKDTYQQELIKRKSGNLKKLITYTTRPMRPKEKNGVDYHFVNEEEFQDFAAENLLVGIREYKSQNGNFKYGINKKDLIKIENQSIILDPSGTLELLDIIPRQNILVVYLESDEKDLHYRAAVRGDDRKSFIERLSQDIEEFKELYAHVNLRLNTSSRLDNLEANIKAIEFCLEEEKWIKYF